MLDALILAFSGALLQTGMGLISYDKLADRLDAVDGHDPQGQRMTITEQAPIAFDPYDYAFQEDPYPVYARLREQEPLHYNEQHDLWVLSRYDDIQHALRTEGTYSNRMGVTIDRSAWNKDAHKVMSFLALDPPDHIRIRSLVARAFTPRRVRELGPRIQELTELYLDPALESGSFDWIKDFAGRLPMDVISEMMGVPQADRDEVRRLADLLVHREEGVTDVTAAGMEAAGKLFAYYAEMLAERRRTPTEDLTSALLAAQIDDDKLTDEEIIAFLFLMVVAGNETTTKLLGHAVFHLTRNPDQGGRCSTRSSRWSRGSRRRCGSTRRRR